MKTGKKYRQCERVCDNNVSNQNEDFTPSVLWTVDLTIV